MLTRPWLVAAVASALLSGEACSQGSWTSMKPIPQGASEVIGAAVDGLLYVYGGERMQTQHVYDGVNLKTQPLGIFWSYDPKADTWTRLKSNPVPVHHGAAVGIGKKFYVLGGFRLPETGRIGWYPENKAWVYDTETQSWSALPPMPTPRGALAAVAVGNKIYAVGGAKIPFGTELADGLNAGGPVELLGTMEVFDTEKNNWTTLKPMTLPRNHHDVAYLDGKLYVIGGTIGSCFPGGWSSNVSMNEVYDIATDTWSTRAPMANARSADGRARSRDDFKGHVTVLLFGFTHCPDICPTALLNLSAVLDQLGEDRRLVQVAFITVDPERDTPDILRDYTSNFGSNFVGLSGEVAAVRRVAKAFKVFFQKVRLPGGDYTMDHSVATYVLDKQARVRLMFTGGRKLEDIAHDILMLLREAS